MSVTNKHTVVPEQATVIKVFDPINKQPYELVFGGPNTEVFPTAGLAAYYDHLGGNKRVFLCKKYQQRQCRAQARCNSIHASRVKVAELRAQHGSEGDNEERTMEVWSEVDNERMTVPVSKIEATIGSAGAYGVLCSAFERGCALGGACPQVHVSVPFVRAQRALWKVACCSDPECPQFSTSCEGAGESFPTIAGAHWSHFRLGSAKHTTRRTMLAVTRGLRRLCMEGGQEVVDGAVVLRIPSGRVCRPHQKRECKWGADCNNVHLCRERGNASCNASTPHTTSTPSIAPTPTYCSSESQDAETLSSCSTDDSDDHVAALLAPFQHASIPTGGIHAF